MTVPTMKNIADHKGYAQSIEFLKRAERSIPLGSQTFSKSKTQLPLGAAPLFATRGEGPYIYDLDGNRYLDFVCSLGAITMGHGDPDINAAVKAQLNDGVLFSLAHPLETEVAELIIEMIPCAEKVRFGKNGSDATAGAIRVARAFTRRDHVAICGYHGWQDWYIGATSRNMGVPVATRELSHIFPYGDLDALDALLASEEGEFAAVIMEPKAFTEPAPDYLQGVKDIAHKHGALLIFDEVVTGFRFTPGSAQARYNCIPDLCSLGKGLANGFPLSAVAGRADIMALMEEVFFSFTMGGETLSLAAAKACLTKAKRENTLESIAKVGTVLSDGIKAALKRHNMQDVIDVAGDPCWTVMKFTEQPGLDAFTIKTLFIQECALRGVLNIGIHFIGYSHKLEHIQEGLAVYHEVFALMRKALDSGDFHTYLNAAPLVPLFSVRS